MSIAFRELTREQRDAYEETLVQSHQIAIRVAMYDQNDELLFVMEDGGSGDFSVEDGQVEIDATEGSPRALRLSLLDPGKRLIWDPATPQNGLYLHRIIGVDYMVRVADLSEETEWVRVPVFFGPVSRFSRSGEFIDLECLGKETLFPPRRRVDSATSRILSDLVEVGAPVEQIVAALAAALGETRVRVDGISTMNMRHSFGFEFSSSAWAGLRRVGRAGGMVVYYDAEGYLVVGTAQRDMTTPRYVFRTGESGAILDDPAIAYDQSGLYNVVRVTSAGVLLAEGRLPATHPLSPESLARNGIPRELVRTEAYEDGVLVEEAEAIVQQLMNAVPIATVDAKFTSLPIPHLSPGDVVGVEFENVSELFELKQFAIPLTVGGTMTIGFTKNLTQNVSPLISYLAPPPPPQTFVDTIEPWIGNPSYPFPGAGVPRG